MTKKLSSPILYIYIYIYKINVSLQKISCYHMKGYDRRSSKRIRR